MNSIENMIAIIQSYIGHRKGVEIEINMNQFQEPKNIILLNEAYNTAVNWFNNNKGQINSV